MGTHAFGTTFKWNNQTVAKLTAINGIELTVESIDATTHQSADSYKEYIAGLIEAGDVALEGYFDATDTNGQLAMLADLNTRTTRASIITFPVSTGATWSFNGFITNLKIGDAPIAGQIPFSATIKPTGKPTFAVATATGMSALVISDSAVLSPAFAIGTFDYVATVLNGVASVTFTPTSAAGTITITANGLSQTVASTAASSAITLAVGINTVVVVISEANKASKTYTFRVVRAA